jgi:hypothetical protein
MIEVLDVAAARLALVRRALSCPDCGGALRPWGRARPRTVRDVGEGVLTIRPDRARCTACQATHVVLPVPLLPHRAYTVRFVGQALVAAAYGRGHRLIAAELGMPPDTVRGWVRRARQGAQQLRALGIQAVVALDPEALPTRVLGDELAHALEALVAAAVVAGKRFRVRGVDLWSQIAVLTRGQLLAPARAG